ncbi:hypothetical protein [Lysinibacillus sp. NPDC047702]|uniref:hypothetical protein n=1 Tax=unclassified Lysinibacillus TaxID=2636778 RepID=UPI003D054948
MDALKKLELEIAKLKACREDLYTAINEHNNRGQLKEAAECGQKIKNISITISRVEAHIRDHNNFMWLINNLDSRGILPEELKRNVH